MNGASVDFVREEAVPEAPVWLRMARGVRRRRQEGMPRVLVPPARVPPTLRAVPPLKAPRVRSGDADSGKTPFLDTFAFPLTLTVCLLIAFGLGFWSGTGIVPDFNGARQPADSTPTLATVESDAATTPDAVTESDGDHRGEPIESDPFDLDEPPPFLLPVDLQPADLELVADDAGPLPGRRADSGSPQVQPDPEPVAAAARASSGDKASKAVAACEEADCPSESRKPAKASPPAVVQASDKPEEAAAAECGDDRTFGTALTWAESPQEAARQARRQGKLVYLIHLSGNFEKPGYT